jgi:dynein heavy chain
MWRGEWRNVTFPQHGIVFDYCVNHETKKCMSWTEISPKFFYVPGHSAADTLVFAPETTQITFIPKQLLESGHPVTLASFAGTGKSVLVRNLLSSLNEYI